MADYMPDPDPTFDSFFNTLNDWVQSNGTAAGVSTADQAALGDGYDAWHTAFLAHQTAASAALAARQTKDSSRAEGEPIIRRVVRVLQTAPTVTNAVRAQLGLTIADTTRTAAAVPTTRPLAMVDTSQRLRHTIQFKDETTPNSKKKPEGVMGAEIWCSLGPTPPTDIGQCSFVALDTSTPYVVEYEGSDANKVAHYLLRWVNTRGEKGPVSETVSATIGA